jgi:hypothetical protein
MKTTRSYVFVFVPILFERAAYRTVRPRFSAGSNGSSLTDHKNNETSRWRGRYREGGETRALPSDLFWTWFVDNPRRNLQ